MSYVVFHKWDKLKYYKRINVKDYAHVLAPGIVNRIQSEAQGDEVYVSGVNGKWNSSEYFFNLQPGDWQLFFDDKGLGAAVQTLLTIQNSQLSTELWGTSEFDCICFCKALYLVNIPYSDFNRQMGYGPSDWWYGKRTRIPRSDLRGKATAIIEDALKVEIQDLPDVKTPSNSEDDLTPRPMIITGFVVDDKLHLGNLTAEFTKKKDEIIAYHSKSEFDFTSHIARSDRQPTTITITIENGPDISENNKLINKKIEELEKVIAKSGLDSESDINSLGNIVRWLRDRQKVYKEFRELIETLFEIFDKGKEIEDLILSIEDMISDNSVLGIFQPSSGIHLYYDRIKDSADCNSFELLDLISSVAAHEMEHAWHYADVKSKSGKWAKQDIQKYKWVKESITEYFSRCYCSNVGNKAKLMRYKCDFPYDGGYSGALMLEDSPYKFEKVYKSSLDDMEKAFSQI